MEHHLISLIGLIPKGRQRLVGSLAGAVRPRKGNMGAQRSAQAGQKSAVEGEGHMPA